MLSERDNTVKQNRIKICNSVKYVAKAKQLSGGQLSEGNYPGGNCLGGNYPGSNYHVPTYTTNKLQAIIF